MAGGSIVTVMAMFWPLLPGGVKYASARCSQPSAWLEAALALMKVYSGARRRKCFAQSQKMEAMR